MEEAVGGSVRVTVDDDDDAMRRFEVEAERFGVAARFFFRMPSEHVVDEIASEPQLCLGDRVQPRQLDREHCRGVLQRDEVGWLRRTFGIPQRDHTDDVVGRAGDRDDAVVDAHRAVGRDRETECLGASTRCLLVISLGKASCPRACVPVAVLDRDRKAGQLVQGVGNRLLPGAACRKCGQPDVNSGAALEGGDRCGKLVVCDRYFGRVRPFTGVATRVRERHRRLLSERAKRVPLALDERPVGRHDEVAETPSRLRSSRAYTHGAMSDTSSKSPVRSRSCSTTERAASGATFADDHHPAGASNTPTT